MGIRQGWMVPIWNTYKWAFGSDWCPPWGIEGDLLSTLSFNMG